MHTDEEILKAKSYRMPAHRFDRKRSGAAKARARARKNAQEYKTYRLRHMEEIQGAIRTV